MCAAQRGLLACLVRGGLPCPTLARRSCGGDSAEPSRGLVMAPTPAPGSKRRVQAARTHRIRAVLRGPQWDAPVLVAYTSARPGERVTRTSARQPPEWCPNAQHRSRLQAA